MGLGIDGGSDVSVGPGGAGGQSIDAANVGVGGVGAGGRVAAGGRARVRALQLWVAAVLGASLLSVACGRTLLDDAGGSGAAGAAHLGAGGDGGMSGPSGTGGGSGNGITGGVGVGGNAFSGKVCTTSADCNDQGTATDCFNGVCTCHNACNTPPPSQVGRPCATNADCFGVIPQELVICSGAVCQCITSDCSRP